MHVKYEETEDGAWIFKIYTVGHGKPTVKSLPYKTLEMAWIGYAQLEYEMRELEDGEYEPGYRYKPQPDRFPEPSKKKRRTRKQKRRAKKKGLLLGLPEESRQRQILNARTGDKRPF